MSFVNELRDISSKVKQQRKKDYEEQAAVEKEKFETKVKNEINAIKASAMKQAEGGYFYLYVYGVIAEKVVYGVVQKKNAYLREECTFQDLSPYWQRLHSELTSIGFKVVIQHWQDLYPDDPDDGVQSGYRFELRW